MLKFSRQVALLAFVVLVSGAAADRPATINIPFERYTLPNGLTVILSQDRATPTVAVNVWYHVGSKNEAPGRTGFAHLFEHVMFTGSGHVPYGLHDKLTEGVGGTNNGTTSNDRTTYYETVPSNYLESALWIEADRMGFLLDTLDLAKLNAQRDIVKNERRQSLDNQPYGRAGELLSQATYPSSHPYSWDVIGSMADLSAASEEDVKKLLPAVLRAEQCVSVDRRRLRSRAGQDVGGEVFRRRSAGSRDNEAGGQSGEADRREAPRVRRSRAGAASLRAVAIRRREERRPVCSRRARRDSDRPRTARLTKALVFEQQAAANVSARQGSNEDVGEFLMVITPRPGHSLTDLEAAADSVIEKMKADGPTAEEIQKAVAGEELAFIRGLESNLDKAMTLSDGAGFHGDPAFFKTEYQKSLAVTAADVKRVANTYLTKGRVVLSIVPTGKLDQAAKPNESRKVTANLTSRGEVGQ